MALSRPSLLFITTELPWPPDSGGKIKSFRLVQSLCESFEVRVLCAYGGTRKEDVLGFRQETGASNVQSFHVHRPRTFFGWIIAILKFPTFNAYRIYSKEMEAMIRWGVEKSDIVIADHLESLEMIPVKALNKVIYHSHNAEFTLWKSQSKLEGNFLRKIAIAWEAERVMQFERWMLKRVKWTFASPNDAHSFQSELNLDGSRFKHTYHLGNDQLLDLPYIDFSSSKSQIFYAGTLSWMPNRDGLVWFITKCWNKILNSHSDARLVVCGAGADHSLNSLLCQTPGVEYKGYVNDLEPLMNSSICAIVPLRYGSGMKIKAFDAMYRGLPLVSTSIGVEGISLKPAEHAHIVNEADAFAEAVNFVLDHKVESAEMAKKTRIFMHDHFRYAPLLETMKAELLLELQSVSS